MHEFMKKLQAELHDIGEKGFSTTNIDNAMKFVDMYKDLKYVEHLRENDGLYAAEEREMRSEEGHGKDGARFDRNINELYDKYLAAKREYAKDGSAVHREHVTMAIEHLMSEVCDLLFDIHRDCDFREEREIVTKYVDSMKTAK